MVTQNINPNKAYRVTEVAEILGVSNAEVMRLIESGKLRAHSMPTGRGHGRRLLTLGDRIRDYVAANN